MTLQSRLTAFAQAVGADIKDLNSKLAVSGILIDKWHVVGAAGEPAYGANLQGYGDFSAGYANTAFRKDVDGRVQIRGMTRFMTAQTPPVNLFTLPVGYRPPYRIVEDVYLSGTVVSPGRVDILTDGTVQLVLPSTQIPIGGWLTFEFSFDTESVASVISNVAVPMDSWHRVGQAGEPAFQNNWTNYSPTANVAMFRKFPDGKVKLTGYVKGGTTGTVIFTLPVGYWPVDQVAVAAYVQGGASLLTANPDGTIIITQNTGVVNTLVSLDALEFDTESVSSYVTGLVQLDSPALVSVLPVSPVDGQECYYLATAAATGTQTDAIWHLRYRVATLKWEFLGGMPIVSRIDTDETYAESGTGVYNDTTTVGPQITLPLPGDYAYEFNANLYIASQTTPAAPAAGFALSTSQPAATDIANGYCAVGMSLTVSKSSSLLGQPAGRIFKLMYNVSTGAGGTAHARWRVAKITPLRLG